MQEQVDIAETREPVILAASIIAAWRYEHALPTLPCADHDVSRVEPDVLRPLHTITHAHVSTACIRRGDDAERAFLAAMERQGWTPLKVSFSDNYQKHVDFRLYKNGEQLRVDVKSMRSLRRNGSLQNSLMFVEMHEGGWLLSGHADVIAQQVSQSPATFVLLDRQKLKAFALSCVDMKAPRVAWPEQSYLRLYRRAGRSNELISLIDLEGAVTSAGCSYV